MTFLERSLEVSCDELMLSCSSILPKGPRGLVLLLHGIPGSPDPDDPGYPGFARRFADEGWAAIWGDMRAAREAPGHFSIEGWVRDAQAMVQGATGLEGVAGRPVAIVGSSAGGAVAVEVAKRSGGIDGLVLLAAPAAWISFSTDAAAGVRRITEEAGMVLAPETLADPTAWAAEFDTVTAERSIGDLTVPTLIVHGTADDVVPVDHARRLAAAAPNAELVVIEGAGHTLRRDERAVGTTLGWLEKMLL